MEVYPTKLALLPGDRLLIEWNDARKREYTVAELRSACPCASCREKRSAPPPPPTLLPVLSAAEARPLAILEMNPVGNYAYSIHFSDGHNTGIYTLELLRALGREVQ
ncbi:MAG: DUF971 domain-containing protein [Planctomycetes bacterium]|nr:DUF971 domain-containing protein [Planctomycetota bacterium]